MAPTHTRTLLAGLMLVLALGLGIATACGNATTTTVISTSGVGGQPPQPTNNPCSGTGATGSPAGLAAASPSASPRIGTPGIGTPTGNGMVATPCGSPGVMPGSVTGTATP